MIAFSLFLIINSHLSTEFTATPDGHSKGHIFSSFTQLMISMLLFDYLLKTII